MKKLLAGVSYGLLTVLLMTLIISLPGNPVAAEDLQTSLTIHVGQTLSKNYTTNTTTPTVATSLDTSVVAVSPGAVTVTGPAGDLIQSTITYIAVTPGAATVNLMMGTNVRSIRVTVQDHVWNTEYTLDEASTCQTHGHESIHCSICDAIQPGSSREVELAPHTWADLPTVDVEPTYFEPGIESIHCTVCDAIDETSVNEIPKLRLERAKIKTLKNPKAGTTILRMKKMEGTSHFTICFSLKNSFKKATIKYTSRKVKIKNLIVGKTYYFRVRATLKEDGKKVHGKWSKVKSITIKQ